MQRKNFSDVFGSISSESPNNLQRQLGLYIDEGILRSKGRIDQANLSARRPVLLPNDERFTQLLKEKVHEPRFHNGVSWCLSQIRYKYWIPQGRATVRSILNAKLLKQGYSYHKIRKAFSKFYPRYSELIVKYKIGLKTLLQQGISEPIFYGDLVNKFKQIGEKSNFSDQFKKIVSCNYIRVGYSLDIMRQSATIYSYGFLLKCTTVGQALDSMTALT